MVADPDDTDTSDLFASLPAPRRAPPTIHRLLDAAGQILDDPSPIRP